ncbi:MAG: hypothetical protein M4579_005861 [Chaenotheca gracillima]|nr:MAG: hypothetical protein M4579_005861 [Chaenotheca gracillima]
MAAPREGASSPPARNAPAPSSPHIEFLGATQPGQRRISGGSAISSRPSMSEKLPLPEGRTKSQSISSSGNTFVALGGNEAERDTHFLPVRTLPTWVRSFDDEDENFDPARRLLTPPQHVQIAQHNHAPASKHKAEPGRLYDFARDNTAVTINQPVREHASRWQTFATASAYPVVWPERSEKVGEDWMRENMPDLEAPWHATRGDDEEMAEDGTLFVNKRKRKAWWRRFHRSLLRNPIVPLIFRLTIWIFSMIALALGASIYAYSRSYAVAQRPSTLMAIIFDAIALVYILYITYDEYRGKPLGLRSPAGKMRLILLDLFFIIFNSANLSLAFDALSDVRWFCTQTPSDIASSALDMDASTNGIALSDPSICHRQRALAGVLLVALVAWLVTFNISVIRLVERVTRD